MIATDYTDFHGLRIMGRLPFSSYWILASGFPMRGEKICENLRVRSAEICGKPLVLPVWLKVISRSGSVIGRKGYATTQCAEGIIKVHYLYG